MKKMNICTCRKSSQSNDPDGPISELLFKMVQSPVSTSNYHTRYKRSLSNDNLCRMRKQDSGYSLRQDFVCSTFKNKQIKLHKFKQLLNNKH